MSKALNLVGKKFGRLLVQERAKSRACSAYWKCRCECGAIVEARGSDMRRGKKTSCGCLRSESVAAHNRSMTTHGHAAGGSVTSEYAAWRSMLARCTNPKHKSYADYGGRGVTVCERWMEDFASFLADVGRKPSPHLSLDRIDPDGNYEPGNCRWATWGEQRRNQRRMFAATNRSRR